MFDTQIFPQLSYRGISRGSVQGCPLKMTYEFLIYLACSSSVTPFLNGAPSSEKNPRSMPIMQPYKDLLVSLAVTRAQSSIV